MTLTETIIEKVRALPDEQQHEVLAFVESLRQAVGDSGHAEADAASRAHKLTIPRERVAEFCRRHRVRWLALFGSAVRNDLKLDSDVDVLVEFEPGAAVGMMALVEMQEELTTLFQRPVDLVPKDGLKRVIRDTVLASAEVIYAT